MPKPTKRAAIPISVSIARLPSGRHIPTARVALSGQCGSGRHGTPSHLFAGLGRASVARYSGDERRCKSRSICFSNSTCRCSASSIRPSVCPKDSRDCWVTVPAWMVTVARNLSRRSVITGEYSSHVAKCLPHFLPA